MKNSSLAVYLILGVLAFFALVKVFQPSVKKVPVPAATEEKSKLPESLISKEEEDIVLYGSGALRESNLSTAEGKKLLQNFTQKKDEFKQITFYHPKSAPRYANSNGLYLYFGVSSATVNPLRLRMQYYSDDWLFIEGVTFLIDGQPYELRTGSFERDHDADIWEWYDEELNNTSSSIISKLMKCKKAKIRFHGKQYYDDRQITDQQLKAIRQTVELHTYLKS